MSGIPNWVHQTWAKTYQCKPELFFKPDTIEQVQEIIALAKKNNTTVTVVGAGHSPSTLTMTQGWLVSLDKLDRILGFKDHGSYTDVEVEAGIRLYELNEVLAEKGLALKNLGTISEQSVAGVISTGTHGSSAYHGLISEQIVSLTLATADGKLIECSDALNRDIFKGALLSLGKLGIIVKAVLRVVPAFKLESVQETASFDVFMKEIWPTFFTSAEFHRVWWYPYANKVVLWRANRTTKPISKIPYSFYGTGLGRWLYEALLWVAVAVRPSWTPAVERWLFRNQFGSKNTYNTDQAVHAVHRSDKAINMDCLFSQFVNEWALPLENGPDALYQLQQEIQKGNYYVHAPFEIRASNTTLPEEVLKPGDGATVAGVRDIGTVHGNVTRPLLDTSPKLPFSRPPQVSYKNLTLNLNATIYRPFHCNAATRDWYTDFERICDSAGGKPHWAKNFIGTAETDTKDHHMAGVKNDIDRWYGEDVQTWRELRAKMDPTGVFINCPEWLAVNGLGPQ